MRWTAPAWRQRWPRCRWVGRCLGGWVGAPISPSPVARVGSSPRNQSMGHVIARPLILVPARLPGLQGLGEGQELPPEVITSLFEALTYDSLLEGARPTALSYVAFCIILLHSCRSLPLRPLLLRVALHRPAHSAAAAPPTPADAECADALAGALCTLCTRYDLALAEPGAARYPGAYRLLAHPSADARRLVSRPCCALESSTLLTFCRPCSRQKSGG